MPETVKPPPLLEARDVVKHYPIRGGVLYKQIAAVKAVDGVTMTIGRGQTVGLVGESGCGKTTFGRAILRLEEPSAGQVRFDGQDILACSPQQMRALRDRQVPLDALLVTQKLSRELEAYRSPSPVARAAAQLAAVGKDVRPGQHVRFLHTLGESGVRAWDLPSDPDPRRLDFKRYTQLLLRAASTVLQPLGVSPETLRAWPFSVIGMPGFRVR